MTKRKTINIYALYITGIVVLLLYQHLPNIPFKNIYDDVVAAALIVPAAGMLLSNHIPDSYKKMGICLVMLAVIGSFSNLIYDYNTSLKDIINALFSFLRIYIVFFAVYFIFYLHPQRIRRTIPVLSLIAKVFITVSFIFGILNMLGYVEMYNHIRYGIKSYYFVFENASQFGIMIGVLLSFILIEDGLSEQKNTKYFEIMAIVTLIMTTKGMSLIIASVYLVLKFLSVNKIKWWHLLIGAVVLLFALRLQINSYILDETAPRAVLLYYGFVTGMHCFPFGSGFGTYGSAIAASHYSPLYVQYGFPNRRILSDAKYGYLNDVYIGMVVGEMGFIGLGLWLYTVAMLGIKLFKSPTKYKKAKHIAIACFACMCGMFVMAGSVKNAPGELIMITLGLYLAVSGTEMNVEE